MTEATFYRKYSNMPLEKRGIEITDIKNGFATGYSPHFIYTELNRLTNIRRANNQAIEDLLEIANLIK